MLAPSTLPVRAHADETPPFVFIGIPDQDEGRLVERFGKVTAYLEGKLGVPVSALDRAQGAAVLTEIGHRHETQVLALHDVALALAHATRT